MTVVKIVFFIIIFLLLRDNSNEIDPYSNNKYFMKVTRSPETDNLNYSLRKLCEGLARAARKACVLTMISASNRAVAPAKGKIHHIIEMRYG